MRIQVFFRQFDVINDDAIIENVGVKSIDVLHVKWQIKIAILVKIEKKATKNRFFPRINWL